MVHSQCCPESLTLSLVTLKRPYKFRWAGKADFNQVIKVLSCVVHRATETPLIADIPVTEANVSKDSHASPVFIEGKEKLKTKQAILAKIINTAPLLENLPKNPIHDPRKRCIITPYISEFKGEKEKSAAEELEVKKTDEQKQSFIVQEKSEEKLPNSESIQRPPSSTRNLNSRTLRPLSRNLSISGLNTSEKPKLNIQFTIGKPEQLLAKPSNDQTPLTYSMPQTIKANPIKRPLIKLNNRSMSINQQEAPQPTNPAKLRITTLSQKAADSDSDSDC